MVYYNIEQIPLDRSRVCVDMYQKTTEQRFWSKVDKTNSCWEWIAGKNNGYGQFKLNGKMINAHRISYILTKGSIPEGLQINHICRNHSCVNPDHLEAVTQKENVLKGIGACAINSRKTCCILGHKFTEENTYLDSVGRHCKICRKITNHNLRLNRKKQYY